MEEEPLPDWLTGMRGQPPDEGPVPEAEAEPLPSPPPVEEPLPAGEPREEMFARWMADEEMLEGQDVLEGLRDQMSEDDFDYYDSSSGEGFKLSSPIPGLKPWQCLVVAILFALDVALCGCMILVMTGRVALPY